MLSDKNPQNCNVESIFTPVGMLIKAEVKLPGGRISLPHLLMPLCLLVFLVWWEITKPSSLSLDIKFADNSVWGWLKLHTDTANGWSVVDYETILKHIF